MHHTLGYQRRIDDIAEGMHVDAEIWLALTVIFRPY